MLKYHSVPSRDYNFPEEYMGGCKQRFKLNWLDELPGLIYSPLFDGEFCLPGAIFITDRDKYGVLVNNLFVYGIANLTNKSPICQCCITINHQSVQSSEAFIKSIEQPQSTVTVMHEVMQRHCFFLTSILCSRLLAHFLSHLVSVQPV